jgi:predicted transcriptional regulator
MVDAKHLNEAQKGQIDVLLNYNRYKSSKIAWTLGLSPSRVSRYINKRYYNKRSERRGRKKKLSQRDVSLIVRSASNNTTTTSARKVHDLQLNVTSRAVRYYVLHACRHLNR